MDYSKFDIADLLTDDAFLRWAQQPDEASDRFWAEFLAVNPQRAETVRKARRMAQDLEQAQRDSAAEDESTLRRMWGHIEENTIATPVRRIGNWHLLSGYAAAAVLLMLGAFWWFGQSTNINQDLPAVMNTATADPQVAALFTTAQGPRKVALPDGSRIQLSANSSLRFPKAFDPEKREVYLVGEAFFEVVKQPQQPFLVHTDEIVTRVIGTSFRVKAFKNQRDVSVDVKTGKVTVYIRQSEESNLDPKNSVTLTPNQKVIYEAAHEGLQKRVTENPIPLTKNIPLIFDDAPIREVFQAMERVYGIPILYDKTSLAQCTLTTSIDDLTLFDQMKLICKAVGATYDQQDGQIVVWGGGCFN